MNLRRGIRSSFPYVVAIAGGFLIAYMVVAVFVFPSGVITRDAKIPNVTGMSYDDASKQLAKTGFKARRGQEVQGSDSPRGTVLEQNPAAGTREVEGTIVTLEVSAGPSNTRTP